MAATILAIETATACCSVALSHQGELNERSLVGNNIHSQVLLEMVQELLQLASIAVSDLNAVAVGQGPGSFTGLRIGVGVAQGIAYGADCPMIGVSSLDALAITVPDDGVVLAGIDARMGEVYWAAYDKKLNTIERITPLHVSLPQAISVQGSSPSQKRMQLVGNAWQEYAEQLSADLNELISKQNGLDADIEYPTAASLILLATQAFERGETISAVDFAPEYVRNNVAKKPKKSSK